MIEAVRAMIEAHQAALSLLILAAMFVGFLMERLPATVIAVLGACTYLALGILDAEAVYSVFSNSAPIVIGAMFVLSGALIRTGVIQRVADTIMARAEKRPRLAIVEVLLGALVASAFLNNTPVVVVLLPIMIKLADVTGISAKKLLMPLSIAAVLGGTLTLIGTSTNLVVDGIVRDAGMPRFGIFEITPIGLVTAASGMIGLAAMWWLLPSDRPVKGDADPADAHHYLTELILQEGDELIGERVDAFKGLPRSGRIVGVRRGSVTVHGADLERWTLAEGDRLILRVDGATLLTWREQGRFRLGIGGGEPADDDMVVETMVAPTHPSIGQRLADIPFLQRIRARIIGIDRPAHEAGPDLASVRIRAADRLLVTGGPREVEALRDNPGLIGADLSRTRAFRRRKAWIAILCMAGVVSLAALDVMPIGVAAIIAIGVILATRCIDSDEAWGTIDGDVLVLIFAMLAVGLALENSGAVAMMVGWVEPALVDAPRWVLVFGIYFFALILSELLSNNAVAALMTPVTLALAAELGVDPRPLVIALMIGASACFATPIGYQTNTIVYAAGDYRFVDFVKIGVPLNIITGVSTCLAIVFFLT
ncbi:SLC13 family permease [Sphingopyxis panaciterrulae]|uniref:Di/tricarboxylate transporter n=1 Tax=Sphingopyxis panaciterrulae TaxID=462372 RepID=A0A7W9ET30_9SPHN|nr:SLC13 family permease [Sphingopyxis panaciterrulae]MBB5707551.1 di/tricarboxylate transporter [Sphingopyxis panaciterrulae]